MEAGIGKPVSLEAMAAIWSNWSLWPLKLLPVLCWKWPISLLICRSARHPQGETHLTELMHAPAWLWRLCLLSGARRVSHADKQARKRMERTMLGLASAGGGAPPSLRATASLGHAIAMPLPRCLADWAIWAQVLKSYSMHHVSAGVPFHTQRPHSTGVSV